MVPYGPVWSSMVLYRPVCPVWSLMFKNVQCIGDNCNLGIFYMTRNYMNLRTFFNLKIGLRTKINFFHVCKQGGLSWGSGHTITDTCNPIEILGGRGSRGYRGTSVPPPHKKEKIIPKFLRILW